jgi:hypothetical protein
MNRWEPRDGGHYCTVHDAAFPRGEVCLACVSEPGSGPDDEHEEESPLDKELRLLETSCHQRSKRLWDVADGLLDGTDRDVSAGCKASAEAAKWVRVAIEIHERRTVKSELADLIKKYRALLGKDGSN